MAIGFDRSSNRLTRLTGRSRPALDVHARTAPIVVLARAIAARYANGDPIRIGGNHGVHAIELARTAKVFDRIAGSRHEMMISEKEEGKDMIVSVAQYIDSVPLSGIIRIRDMMYSVKDPYRLDQGDVSFDAPDTVKRAMQRAIEDNRSHYLQTTGVPRLLELLANKLRTVNQTPVGSPDEIMVTTGGIHALYIVCQTLLEPGDEVIVPDPEWPPSMGNIKLARGVVVPCPLRERLAWRFDLDELESKITSKTKAIYINSPHNPTGGVLTREDLERIARIIHTHNLWLISDEAYEDVIFDHGRHISPASLPDMYPRTIPFYTFSKTYAMTGLRLGYVAVHDAALRDRMKKVLFYTASNVTSIVQFGGIGALEGSQASIEDFKTELQARRDLFYAGIEAHANGILSGTPPRGAFYAFLKIDPSWQPSSGSTESISWAMAQELISRGRIGCVPGADFGANGEGYVRFCFARDRNELAGALTSMANVFASSTARAGRHPHESSHP